jgi:hypothetical protein
MLSRSQRRLLRWLCRIYGLMLLAYPSTFRREYSREMTLLFGNRARDVVQKDGSWGLLPFMLRISWDWLQTTLRESTNMAAGMPVLRWFAALPSAMLAASVAPRIVGFFVQRSFSALEDFQHVWIGADVTVFLMAAAFVSVGVWVAPSRKDSVARIALSVVVFWGALLLAAVAMLHATTTPHFPGSQFTQWTADMSPGFCILLGGVVAYLPWRRHAPSQASGA